MKADVFRILDRSLRALVGRLADKIIFFLVQKTDSSLVVTLLYRITGPPRFTQKE